MIEAKQLHAFSFSIPICQRKELCDIGRRGVLISYDNFIKPTK